LCLYGNDIDDTTTVLESGLGWIVRWEKGEFLGREALRRQKEAGPERRLGGFEVRGRGIARRGYAVGCDGRPGGGGGAGALRPSREEEHRPGVRSGAARRRGNPALCGDSRARSGGGGCADSLLPAPALRRNA